MVVLPKGAKQPVMGYLVRQDDRTIVIRQELPGGKSRESSFPKKDLDELIITVSPERLSSLDPNKPQTYREYAEELAEKQRDPEARDTAIRLFAVVAARGDDQLRHSALLGLIALARHADEERLFRAAAYIFSSEYDPAILVASAGDAAAMDLSWSEVASKRGLTPLPPVSLDRLTEFDPATCVYRGGKWVRP
ncbi:MAG: hypothetical protein JF612_01815 [Planctomycetia bacterium]|nr:hypothetical protein [Planctomycetia bacterium]